MTAWPYEALISNLIRLVGFIQPDNQVLRLTEKLKLYLLLLILPGCTVRVKTTLESKSVNFCFMR